MSVKRPLLHLVCFKPATVNTNLYGAHGLTSAFLCYLVPSWPWSYGSWIFH